MSPQCLFSSDLHGNLTHYVTLLSHATEKKFPLVIFGGDFFPLRKTAKTHNPKTVQNQKAFYMEKLLPLFKNFVETNPESHIVLIPGNTDLLKNVQYFREETNKTSPNLHFLYNETGTVNLESAGLNVNLLGYSNIRLRPSRVLKEYERFDLKQRMSSIESLTKFEGLITEPAFFKHKIGKYAQSYKHLFKIQETADKTFGEGLFKINFPGSEFWKSNARIRSIFSIEHEIDEILRAQPLPTDNKGINLLVSHMPPYDTACDSPQEGMHVGSRAIRNALINDKFDVGFFGHVHNTVNSNFGKYSTILDADNYYSTTTSSTNSPIAFSAGNRSVIPEVAVIVADLENPHKYNKRLLLPPVEKF